MTTEELQAEKDAMEVKVFTSIDRRYAEYRVALETVYKGEMYVDRAFYPINYKTEFNWLKVKDSVIETFKGEVIREHYKQKNP
jgi:hypothetical protein